MKKKKEFLTKKENDKYVAMLKEFGEVIVFDENGILFRLDEYFVKVKDDVIIEIAECENLDQILGQIRLDNDDALKN
jgi:hypothetical protein